MFFLFLIPFALLLAAISCFQTTTGRRDRVFPPREQIFGTGPQRALIIYQPSPRGGSTMLTQALARALTRSGYTVTVNHPSALLTYDPMCYDLLAFGGNVYVGAVARPLVDYLSSLHFTGKRVLLYVAGEMDKAPELAGLRVCVPAGNLVRSIKVRVGERDKLAAFATTKLV